MDTGDELVVSSDFNSTNDAQTLLQHQSLPFHPMLRLTRPGWCDQTYCGIVDRGGDAEAALYGLSPQNVSTHDVYQRATGEASTSVLQQFPREAPSRALSISFGAVWDPFTSFESRSSTKGFTTPHQSLFTLVTVCLKIQRDVILTVGRGEISEYFSS